LPERPLLSDAYGEVNHLAVLDIAVSALGDEILDILEQIGMPIYKDEAAA